MTYKEFVEELSKLACETETTYDTTYRPETRVYFNHICVGIINEEYQGVLETLPFTNKHIDFPLRKVLSLLCEYASTPIEKRRTEPKYNVIAYRRKRGIPNDMTEEVYFYWRGDSGHLLITDGDTNNDDNQQWSMSQIKSYGLEDYERIRVE